MDSRIARGMQRRLPTLDEHNNQKRLMQQAMARPGAGVMCPKCGAAEMVLFDPGAICTSYPPKTKVHCPSCDHVDFKL